MMLCILPNVNIARTKVERPLAALDWSEKKPTDKTKRQKIQWIIERRRKNFKRERREWIPAKAPNISSFAERKRNKTRKRWVVNEQIYTFVYVCFFQWFFFSFLLFFFLFDLFQRNTKIFDESIKAFFFFFFFLLALRSINEKLHLSWKNNKRS